MSSSLAAASSDELPSSSKPSGSLSRTPSIALKRGASIALLETVADPAAPSSDAGQQVAPAAAGSEAAPDAPLTAKGQESEGGQEVDAFADFKEAEASFAAAKAE